MLPTVIVATATLLCLHSVHASAAHLPRSLRTADIDIDAAFDAFVAEYQRSYASNPVEKAKRKAIFALNMAKAKELEAADPSASYGINKYADVDLEALHARRRAGFEISTDRVTANGDVIPYRELDLSKIDTKVTASFKASRPLASKGRKFKASSANLLAPRVAPSPVLPFYQSHAGGLPESEARVMEAADADEAIDWRDYNVVSAVKQQGNCGSCWSFCTTGNIEALWIISGNNETLLSEEELLACDVQSGNDACQGGLMQAAFWWILKYRSGYISQATTYPFTSGSGYTAPCNFNLSRPGAFISDYADVKPMESSIANVVSALGPVCVGVDSTNWEMYNGGVVTSCSSRNMDHAVLIVGYDTTFTTPYWIVKNSWGTDWGEDGYMRIAMGNNLCMLADIPSTALIPFGARDLPLVAPTTPEPSRTTTVAATIAACILVMATILLALL